MTSLTITPVVTVVDSDPAVRTALVSLIRSAGWLARAFASAREFLACPRSMTPGCLVVDIALPDLDGHYLPLPRSSRALSVSSPPILPLGVSVSRPRRRALWSKSRTLAALSFQRRATSVAGVRLPAAHAAT